MTQRSPVKSLGLAVVLVLASLLSTTALASMQMNNSGRRLLLQPEPYGPPKDSGSEPHGPPKDSGSELDGPQKGTGSEPLKGQTQLGPVGGSWVPTERTDDPREPYEHVCPDGTKMVGMAIRTNVGGANVVNAIGSIKCSDGSEVGEMTGSQGGGIYFEDSSPSGYSNVFVQAGTLLDRLVYYPADGSVGVPRGGNGGTVVPSLDCPEDSHITGIFGTATPTNVITIGVYCGSLGL